jgi:hypothetical protein
LQPKNPNYLFLVGVVGIPIIKSKRPNPKVNSQVLAVVSLNSEVVLAYHAS